PLPATASPVARAAHSPRMAEIQAPAPAGSGGSPRRVVTGLVQSRLNTVVAILSRHLNLSLITQDVYVSTVGGISVNEPAADLAMAPAIISSRKNLPLPRSTVTIGELSLAGAPRPLARTAR